MTVLFAMVNHGPVNGFHGIRILSDGWRISGVAKVEWRKGSDVALAEVEQKYVSVGDELSDHELVYNGGSPKYDELSIRYDGQLV